MSQPAARAEIDLSASMVDALFATPRAIAAANLTVTAVMFVVWRMTDAPAYLILVLAMLAVVWYRARSHKLHTRARNAPAESAGRLTTAQLERQVIVGAWSTAFIIGVFGGLTVLGGLDQPAAVLGIAQTITYLAGVPNRNASHPRITIGQLAVAATPFALALILVATEASLWLTAITLLSVAMNASSIQVAHDVFVSRHKTMLMLEKTVETDAVTGLGNRLALMKALERRAAEGAPLTLTAVDLDQFKATNDTFGHDSGDALLVGVARRLEALAPAGALVARTGGDEFMVLAVTSEAEAVKAANALLHSFRTEPFDLGDCRVSTTVSMGVFEGCGVAVERMLKNVDLALYEAKLSRDCFAVYTPALSQAHEDRLALEGELQQALPRGEIFLSYQPVHCPRTRAVLFAEALMRWRHPTRGSVSPGEFIPIAEQSGLICTLGSWALMEATRAAMAWPEAVGVSVNVSARQLRSGHDLAADVAAALAASGLAPSRLTIEVTESLLIDDPVSTVAVLDAIRATGVRVALDDFGTGYSSLSCLADLPLDLLKIDRSFTRSVAYDGRVRALLDAVTGLARNLGLGVVVEGVEHEEQIEALANLGIEGIQGFAFSRPGTADAVVGHIRSAARRQRAAATKGRSRDAAA